jgi:hypothetical protein
VIVRQTDAEILHRGAAKLGFEIIHQFIGFLAPSMLGMPHVRFLRVVKLNVSQYKKFCTWRKRPSVASVGV